jgi:Prokaryotic dksA/traR C4-type zinc finger
MLCVTCGITIPQARLDAVPHTDTCIRCSKEQSCVGYMDWHHKTAPEIVYICATDKESIRRAKRIDQRSR